MDKKQQILEAAIELFSINGFEKTAISAICEKSNVSKGLVFHYFKNKNVLLREVFLNMERMINDTNNEIDHSLPPREKLLQHIGNIFKGMTNEEYLLFYRLDYHLSTQPATRSILIDLIESRYQLMMDSFDSILCDIPSADNIVDCHMLIAEIDGIALNYLFDEKKYPLEKIQDRFIKKYLLLLEL